MGSSRIRSVYMATENTFSTDPSPTGSGYRFVHAADIEIAPSFGEAIERTVQDDTLDHPGTIIGAQGGTFGFATELRGPGANAAASDGVAAVHGEVGLSLKAIFGACNLGTGTAFGAGWTANSGSSSGTVDDATGINVGDVIYRLDASGRPEARPVTAKVGSTITVTPAWNAEPSEGDDCYAMANYRASNSGHQSESAVVKGDDFEFYMGGLMGSVAIEALNAQGIGRLAFSYQVDDVDHHSAKGALPDADDVYPNPPVVRRAPCWINGQETCITQLAFDLANEVQAKLCTRGEQGRSGWAVVGQGKTGSVQVYFATGLIDLYKNATRFPIFFFMEDGPGNVIALFIPEAQIVSDPGVEDVNGQNGQTLNFRACRPTVNGLASAVLAIG